MQFFPSRTIAVEILGWPIHWYGLLYVAAFLLASWMLPRLQKYRKLSLTHDDWSALLTWAIIGVLAGGRLGFVLFFEPFYFLAHPLEILQVWHGGMSSHGGFIGVTIALYFVCRKQKINLLALADTIVVPVAIGLALGRLGNFINGELYGIQTTLPWGMSFDGADGLRHPTQLYAIAKDLVIAVVCFVHLTRARPVIIGHTIALFLILYGGLRYLLEYFRDQSYGVMDWGFFTISPGQLFTIPIIVAGAYLWWELSKRSR
jgi:phosphatidylglycerol:prolipoprotein diacylglycerol transferase